MRIFKEFIIPAGLIPALPLLGVILKGQAVMPYLVFPPKPVITSHAPFSPPVFTATACFIALAFLPLLKKGMTRKEKTKPEARGRFPLWGYVSFAGLFFFWVMAWTRFDWFKPFQAHTFFPLWLCWIISVNAIIYRSKTQCPMFNTPSKFLFLFMVSSLFWWAFEFLNRFVGNWYYTGSQYPGLEYFLLATLSFSTVLPAVESMKAYLLTFAWFKNRFKHARPLHGTGSRSFGLLMVASSGVLLSLVGIFPEILFFTVWLCPLFLLIGFRILSGRHHILSGAENGDYTMVAAYAAAGLICGFFWEMFNMYSLARWQYSIPYVDILHVFEMPLLGYAGYLPFGLECAVIIELIMGKPS
ncbi:MAG: hypothetical protein GXP56_10330 [Deltaproteobacteria bacterium]|nr:hypothetical protein [Deltaproteobacteria bacterium]